MTIWSPITPRCEPTSSASPAHSTHMVSTRAPSSIIRIVVLSHHVEMSDGGGSDRSGGGTTSANQSPSVNSVSELIAAAAPRRSGTCQPVHCDPLRGSRRRYSTSELPLLQTRLRPTAAGRQWRDSQQVEQPALARTSRTASTVLPILGCGRTGALRRHRSAGSGFA